MLGWWPLPRQRTGPLWLLLRVTLLVTALVPAVIGLLVTLEIATMLVSARSLNATNALPLPRWLDELTERREIAYPAHAAIGTVLETLRLSPAATGVQWLKAAAHAATDQQLERTAQGIAAALARDHDDGAMQILCTIRDIGDTQQQEAARRADLSCQQWTPNVGLVAEVSALQATPGSALTITAQVTSVKSVTGIVDVEIHDAQHQRVAQWVYRQQRLPAGETQTYVVTWDVPPDLAPGQYTVKLGLFEPAWAALHGWKNSAAVISIVE